MVYIGIALGIALAVSALIFIALPAWQIMFATDSTWGLAGLLIGTGLLTSWIHIPTPLRAGGSWVAFNVFGFGAPLAVIIYVSGDIPSAGEIETLWLVLGYVVMAAIYTAALRPTSAGLVISLLLVYAIALVVIFALRGADLTLRQVMFRGFTMQYATLLFADLVRCFVTPPGGRNTSVISIGGAGSSDVLWTGPTVIVIFSYIIAWISGDLPPV